MTSPDVDLNTALAPEDLCPETPAAPPKPVIRFIGGITLEPQVDGRQGTPTNCGNLDSLMNQLAAALAPFQPFLTLLDAVAHIGNCLILMSEAITNPFKIPDLLKCLPQLVEKLNAILALVPIPAIPQGIAALITMIVDIIRTAQQVLACVVSQLRAVEQQLEEVNRAIETLNRGTDDPAFQSQLEHYIECGQDNAAEAANGAMAVLGPMARVFCVIRTLIQLIPGGRAIAEQMAFPSPGDVEALSDTIDALEATSTALETIVSLITSIGSPFGAPLAIPDAIFVCPLDAQFAAEAEADPMPAVEPTVRRVETLAGLLIPTLATIPDSSTPGDYTVVLVGTGYDANSAVYWNTSPLPTRLGSATASALTGEQVLLADVSEDLRQEAGKFNVVVVNVPPGASEPFAGLSATPGAPSPTTETSDPYTVEVT